MKTKCTVSLTALALLWAVCVKAQIINQSAIVDSGTVSILNQVLNQQAQINAEAYNGCAGSGPVYLVDSNSGDGLVCLEPDGTPAWGCNGGGNALVNVSKCQQGGPAGGGFIGCLEETAAHEFTELGCGTNLCDAKKTTQWIVNGFQLADCDVAGVDGCQDEICLFDKILANPTPTPASTATVIPPSTCVCPLGWFQFNSSNLCFDASGHSSALLPCGSGPIGPTPTPSPTPTQPPSFNLTPSPTSFQTPGPPCVCPTGWFPVNSSYCFDGSFKSLALLSCGSEPPNPTPTPPPSFNPTPSPTPNPTPIPPSFSEGSCVCPAGWFQFNSSNLCFDSSFKTFRLLTCGTPTPME